MVDVERRPTLWSDFDGEVVERAAGVLAGDLEDEVASRAGLESQSFAWGQNLGLKRAVIAVSFLEGQIYFTHANR